MVISTGVSDHFITFCTRKSQKEKVEKQTIARIRSTKNYNKEVFNDKLNAIDWSHFYLCRNVQDVWEKCLPLLHTRLDDSVSYRVMKIRQQSEALKTKINSRTRNFVKSGAMCRKTI